jgi:hypothetical protein
MSIDVAIQQTLVSNFAVAVAIARLLIQELFLFRSERVDLLIQPVGNNFGSSVAGRGLRGAVS